MTGNDLRQFSKGWLTAGICQNGLREVAAVDPLADKFRAFGIHADEVDGHHFAELSAALNSERPGAASRCSQDGQGPRIAFMVERVN